MSEQPSGIPARLLFSPLNDGLAAPESDAGHLSDLYFCRSTRRFFTLPSAEFLIEPRSSRSAKQFFCPVCPKSALKLATSLTCPTCGWDASSTGVTNVSELLQRDGDPFPWISAEIRRLTRRLTQPDDAATVVQEPTPTGVPRTNSVHRLRGRRQSLRHIERQKPELQLSKADSASLCAQRFAEKQEEREKRVFSQWMPEMEASDWSGLGRPKGDLEAMMAEVDLDELVDLDQRVCSTTWRKAELAARRRVPPPKVSVRSPFGGGKTRKAVDVSPEIAVWIRDGCEQGTGAGVAVRVFNKQELGELTVTMTNTGTVDEHAEATVAQGMTITITINPFSFREERAADMLQDEPMCTKLAVLDMNFQYAGRDGTVADGHGSQLRVYARHAR